MKRVLPLLIVGLAFLPLSMLSYAAWWAVQYRLPPSPRCFIDLRKDCLQTPFYITFCASLATNPHGFPGHSYVVWSETPIWNNQNAEAFGFVPRYSKDQVTSVFRDVPGLLVHGASEGNLVNLDSLTVVVDKQKYYETRGLREKWDATVFRAGLHDCVSFLDFIAEDAGLAAPARRFSYPQDHLKQMKRLNQGIAASGRRDKFKKIELLRRLCQVNPRITVQF